jgi:hypothetical protein
MSSIQCTRVSSRSKIIVFLTIKVLKRINLFTAVISEWWESY